MDFKVSFFLSLLVLCCSFNNRSRNESQLPDNSADSTMVSENEGYDWTPAGFKQDHYDEWVVVKQSIDIQQKGKIDYVQIDSLVREYITVKNIDLPQDTYLRIKKIEEICEARFDLEGYDDSNMGMHIADGTSRLFDGYIDWLFACEASKVEGTGSVLKSKYF